MQPEIRTLPAMRLAFLRHTGPYGGAGIKETWHRFMQWCAAHQDQLASWQCYGIAHDDPEQTPAAKLRYDCCVEVKPGFEPSGEIALQELAAARYACAAFSGTSREIGPAWARLLGEGLPAAGLQPASAVSLELYPADFVADADTGAFNCLLCVPVQPG